MFACHLFRNDNNVIYYNDIYFIQSLCEGADSTWHHAAPERGLKAKDELKRIKKEEAMA
jgi:hypothetical protein